MSDAAPIRVWREREVWEHFSYEQVRWLKFQRVGNGYVIRRSDGTVVPPPQGLGAGGDIDRASEEELVGMTLGPAFLSGGVFVALAAVGYLAKWLMGG